jgi:hypothetical protein
MAEEACLGLAVCCLATILLAFYFVLLDVWLGGEPQFSPRTKSKSTSKAIDPLILQRKSLTAMHGFVREQHARNLALDQAHQYQLTRISELLLQLQALNADLRHGLAQSQGAWSEEEVTMMMKMIDVDVLFNADQDMLNQIKSPSNSQLRISKPRVYHARYENNASKEVQLGAGQAMEHIAPRPFINETVPINSTQIDLFDAIVGNTTTNLTSLLASASMDELKAHEEHVALLLESLFETTRATQQSFARSRQMEIDLFLRKEKVLQFIEAKRTLKTDL